MKETARLVGRYKLYEKLASGGMATVHLGCALGAVGFARAVVIKRLHREYASDREFVAMFVDEARLASRIRNPNVIPMLDVVSESGELFLVMEYVHGEALGRLIVKHAQANLPIPPAIVSSIGIGMLEGLHAAHEATSEKGEPLEIVHRDVSPQNVLVGADGVTRVFDFGIAKAETRIHETNAGGLKGKMAYMSPEQIVGDPVDRRTDIWAAGVVLWEATTRRRLFVADRSDAYLEKILREEIPPPSRYADVTPAFDEVVFKALSRKREDRFATARDFACALEEAEEPANARVVGQWVLTTAREVLAQRAELVKAVEGSSTDPNSVRRQIAVLELENAPTEVTPTGPPPPTTFADSSARGQLDMRTETGLVVTPSAPPPPATSVPPPGPAPRAGRFVVPIAALVVGLAAGGAVVWSRASGTPRAEPTREPAPPHAATTTTPETSASAPAPQAPASAAAATTPAPSHAALPDRSGRRPPRTQPGATTAGATAHPAPSAEPAGTLDMNNRK